MEMTQQRIGYAVVLRVAGQGGEVAPTFEDALLSLIRAGEADVIVDLSKTGDFRAMQPLIAAEKLRRDQGGLHRLAIVAVPGTPANERLIMNGMRKNVPVFGSVEEVREAWETDGFPA